jgi:hypothetical protein
MEILRRDVFFAQGVLKVSSIPTGYYIYMV